MKLVELLTIYVRMSKSVKMIHIIITCYYVYN